MELDKVIARLAMLGYTYDEEKDAGMLDYSIGWAMMRILNLTNQSEIPDGLCYKTMDIACAEFLKLKKGFGQLSEITFEAVAQSVSAGDTSINFSTDYANPEAAFDASIVYLLTLDEDEISKYRKMVW